MKGIRNVYTILFAKPDERRQLRRVSSGWDDEIDSRNYLRLLSGSIWLSIRNCDGFLRTQQ
jgi:hypothetical protein